MPGCGFIISIQNWYTPEEFEAMYKDRKLDYSSGQSMMKEYVIKDPKTGLRDRVTLLKRTCQEIDAFTEKIFNYYQLK